MATRILGVDLGAYSVKVLVAQPGFRQVTPVEFIERRVPSAGADGAGSPLARAAGVVADIAREHGLSNHTVFAGAAAGELFIHVLEFPFQNLRRPDLEKAVGADLEGILPIDLEDMVFGFEALPDAGAAGAGQPGGEAARPEAGDDDPTGVQGRGPGAPPRHGRVAPPAEGMRVLACAMETARARHFIEVLGERGLEPRGLIAMPAAYARAVEAIEAAESAAAAGGPASTRPGGAHAIIDMGHERTEVCVVVAGRAVYARTFARGGRHASEAIQQAWHTSFEDAERAKHEHGFVASASQPAQSEDQRRMHRALEREFTSMAREIKRSFQSCLARTGVGVERVTLVGGGSRLSGVAPFLGERLRVPVQHLGPVHAPPLIGTSLASAGVPLDHACVVAGLVLDGAGGRPHFDLRQGELAFRADLSFLRQKATAIAAALVIVLAFATFNGFAALYQLRQDEAALETRLALETAALFGEPLGLEQAMGRIGGDAAGEESPLPRMSAYDIMLEMNGKLPDRDQVTLDVQSLEIRPAKVTFQATTKSSPEIDTIEEALDGIECFKDISRGSTSIGAGDVRQFSFTITTNCM